MKHPNRVVTKVLWCVKSNEYTVVVFYVNKSNKDINREHGRKESCFVMLETLKKMLPSQADFFGCSPGQALIPGPDFSELTILGKKTFLSCLLTNPND